MTESHEELAARLNLETGRIEWTELQVHFARGDVLAVSPDLDLLEAAAALANDDKASVSRWMDAGSIWRAGDEDARRWQSVDQGFWAVVVAPWVVVQESSG